MIRSFFLVCFAALLCERAGARSVRDIIYACAYKIYVDGEFGHDDLYAEWMTHYRTETESLLRDASYDPSDEWDGVQSVLHIATTTGYYGIVEALLANRRVAATVNARDTKLNLTALDVATMSWRLVRPLLKPSICGNWNSFSFINYVHALRFYDSHPRPFEATREALRAHGALSTGTLRQLYDRAFAWVGRSNETSTIDTAVRIVEEYDAHQLEAVYAGMALCEIANDVKQ